MFGPWYSYTHLLPIGGILSKYLRVTRTKYVVDIERGIYVHTRSYSGELLSLVSLYYTDPNFQQPSEIIFTI